MDFLFSPRFWAPGAWLADFMSAAQLLTRLPLGVFSLPAGSPPRREKNVSHPARCYPLVGILVGALAALGFVLAGWIGLPPFATALAALSVSILVTGALHEDGLADVADGFGGGRDPKSKLAIMRDSRIGSYGVLALILVLAARGGSLASLSDGATAATALIAAHALSRGNLAAIMAALPLARSDGLAVMTGRPGGSDAVAAFALSVAVALLCLDGQIALVAILACIVVQLALALQARRQIGGVTGDVLGAAQQLGEAAVLLVVAAGAGP